MFFRKQTLKNFGDSIRWTFQVTSVILCLCNLGGLQVADIILIDQRLSSLRQAMSDAGISAYVIPGTDPHQSEYPVSRWLTREFISGFTGSAGTVVVTAEIAGLWTDSRYHLQAEEEIKGTDFSVFKVGLPGVPSWQQWLAERLESGQSVGLDGATHSIKEVKDLQQLLSSRGIDLADSGDLFDSFWEDRPALPAKPVTLLDDHISGMSAGEKMTLLREEMKRRGSTHYFITPLDCIAWLLNLRGRDIPFNPLFVSYLLVSEKDVTLYVEASRLEQESLDYLQENDILIKPYTDALKDLDNLDSHSRILFDPAKTSYQILGCLPEGISVTEAPDIITRLKSRKTRKELQGIRKAMVQDGTAMVKFLCWFDSVVNEQELSEVSLDAKLTEFRSMGDDYLYDSFNAIVGFKDHGALNHYRATPESDKSIQGRGLLLIDSGGQYRTGTSDITRMVLVGEPLAQEREDYTLVLKGMISLSMAQFPAGTRGVQLDLLARKAMWDRGFDFGHGTGHGIGFYLNVHEGPQSISPRLIDIPLEEGMVTSNEPGLYRTGQYGIRIENLIAVTKSCESEFGSFFKFETLTLCPIETRLIEIDLLSDDEIAWMNEYHKKVNDTLSTFLSPEERDWLRKKTAPLVRNAEV